MSIRIMSLAWAVQLPAGDKLVLLALADCANDEGHCWPGIKSLCAKTGKSERSLQSALKALETAEQITRDQVPGKGCNYTVHPRNSRTPAELALPQKTTRTPAKSAPKPSGTVITKKGKPSSRAPAKPKIPLPKNWQPKPFKAGSVCAEIVAAWQPGRIERELSKFRDHHLRSDARWSDWDAAWRTWVQRAGDFEKGGHGNGHHNQRASGWETAYHANMGN